MATTVASRKTKVPPDEPLTGEPQSKRFRSTPSTEEASPPESNHFSRTSSSSSGLPSPSSSPEYRSPSSGTGIQPGSNLLPFSCVPFFRPSKIELPSPFAQHSGNNADPFLPLAMFKGELERGEIAMKELFGHIQDVFQNMQQQAQQMSEYYKKLQEECDRQMGLVSPSHEVPAQETPSHEAIPHEAPSHESLPSHDESTPSSQSSPPSSHLDAPGQVESQDVSPAAVHLKILTQPPSQAIYQRILRPFPVVAVVGELGSAHPNYFVEVSLLKKSSSFDKGNDYQQVAWFKNGGCPLDGDKEKNLINGQAVFRKLKILTTSTQQGAFFVLKFTLKRYVNSVVEVVPEVQPIVSNPIEVFSHTLYLKSASERRPREKSSSSRSKNSSRGMDVAASHGKDESKSSGEEGNHSHPESLSPSSSPAQPSASHDDEEEDMCSADKPDHPSETSPSLPAPKQD